MLGNFFFCFTIRRMGIWAQCLEPPELYRFAFFGLLFIHKHLRLFRFTDQVNVHVFVCGRKQSTGRKTHAIAKLQLNTQARCLLLHSYEKIFVSVEAQ